MKIIIGTRGSQLALWQAEYVAAKIQAFGAEAELKIIETKGDKILDTSLSKIGSKGVFTEELELALSTGEIHIAVHSAKDVPSELPKGLDLIAFTEREIANDVLVSFKDDVDLNGNFVIGTSSTRRRALLQHHYPNVKLAEMRGNLQTRFRKLENGECDAMILAYAGVHRMGYDKHIVRKLPLEQFVPPVGQGSVAIQANTTLVCKEGLVIIRKACNHPESETCLLAERAFLKEMKGGCSVPVFAYAVLNDKTITLKGGIVSLDGKEKVEFKSEGESNSPEQLGIELANKVLSSGGKEILAKIKEQL